MMKRNQWWIAGALLGVGVTMLLASGLSAMANTSGYEAYKEALLQTKAAESVTARATVTVSDNGSALLAGSATVKLNHGEGALSAEAVLEGEAAPLALQLFRQDGDVIVKRADEEVYHILKGDGQAPLDADRSGPPEPVVKLFEALTGHMRQLATVESDGDGGRHASLHLSGGQIPGLLNAVVALAASSDKESGGAWRHGPGGSGFAEEPGRTGEAAAPFHPAELELAWPKLTNGARVDDIRLDAWIRPDGLLERQTAAIRIVGTDAAGEAHTLLFELRIDFEGYYETVPERVDLTDKPTAVVTHDDNAGPKRGWRH